MTEGSGQGGDRKTIAVLDFPGFRAGAPLSELRLEDAGYRVRYLLAEDIPLEAEGDRYAASLRDRLGADADDLVAVVGYCLSAPIAGCLAEQIGSRRPSLVTLDAGTAGDEDVREVLVGASDQLGMGAARLAPDLLPPYASPRDLPSRLAAGLREVAEQGLGPLLEPEEAAAVAAEMASLHLGWILHVIAAADAGPSPASGQALHLMSREHVLHDEWLSAPEVVTVRTDGDESALVTDPETRSALLKFLAGR